MVKTTKGKSAVDQIEENSILAPQGNLNRLASESKKRVRKMKKKSTFYKELVLEGITARMISHLANANIGSCNALMKAAKKGFIIDGLLELEVYDICVVAEELLNSGRVTGSHALVKEVLKEQHKDVANNNGFLYMSGIPADANNKHVDAFLKGCGTPSLVDVIKEEEGGLCKGYGFLKYSSPGSIAIALSRNGKSILGQTVSVEVGDPKMRRIGR